MSSSVRENAATTPPAADCWVDGPQRSYSFSAYLRSHAGFAIGAVALVAVTAGIMAVTSSNASAIALVSLCEAAFACVALAAGFLRDREFYQQLDLFCDSPENARCLSSILDEPRALEGSIAYRALAVQGKAASDELTARSRDMKEYRNYIELWVHETKTPIASAQLALASLHGPEIGKVRGDLDRIESRVEQALYYARSATLSEDFSIEKLNLAALARKACRQRSRTLIGAGVSLEFAIDEALDLAAQEIARRELAPDARPDGDDPLLAQALQHREERRRRMAERVVREYRRRMDEMGRAAERMGLSEDDVRQMFEDARQRRDEHPDERDGRRR